MKKATVIVIAAIYVASIVIVGVFGIQALMYNETIPITDFILDKKINGSEVYPATDGNGYTVRLSYEEGLTVPIEFVPVPADATMRNSVKVEITYQTGSEEKPTARLIHFEVGGYMLEFLKVGTVTVTIKSVDNHQFSKSLSITAI